MPAERIARRAREKSKIVLNIFFRFLASKCEQSIKNFAALREEKRVRMPWLGGRRQARMRAMRALTSAAGAHVIKNLLYLDEGEAKGRGADPCSDFGSLAYSSS